MADFLLDNPNVLGSAAIKAEFLKQLSFTTSKTSMDALVLAMTGNIPDGSGLRADTDDCPRFYWANIRDACFIAIAGAVTPNQASGLWQGYLGPRFGGGNVPHQNKWLSGAATIIMNAVVPSQLPKDVCVFGFSAGGSAMWECVNREPLVWANNGCLWSLTSFGAPAPSSGFQNATPFQPSRTTYCRWFSDDDPVPTIPPPNGALCWVTDLVSLWQRNQANSFYQPGNSLAINVNFQVIAQQSPGNILPLPAAIIAWLQQTAAGLVGPHSIITYAARLRAANALIAPQNVPQPNVVPGVPLPPMNVQQFRGSNRAVFGAIINDASRQNAAPVNVPASQICHILRSAKLYYVFFGNAQIAITPHKKTARALVKSINTTVYKLLKLAVVDPVAFANQWANLMGAMTDPSSGFTPQLNTTP